MWVVYAIFAAILWGINYTLAEKILRSISTFTLLALEMLLGAVVFAALSYFTTMKRDIMVLQTEPKILWLTLAEIAVVLLASYFIATSIQAKNATVAGIIELIYPLFTILFTWLFFGENHIDTSVIIGGILIFMGVLMISTP